MLVSGRVKREIPENYSIHLHCLNISPKWVLHLRIPKRKSHWKCLPWVWEHIVAVHGSEIQESLVMVQRSQLFTRSYLCLLVHELFHQQCLVLVHLQRSKGYVKCSSIMFNCRQVASRGSDFFKTNGPKCILVSSRGSLSLNLKSSNYPLCHLHTSNLKPQISYILGS